MRPMRLSREHVAGSALALWLRRGPCVQLDLMACTGAHITYYEATDFLGRRDWAPLDFAMWSTNRIRTANAALALWQFPRDIPQAWFRCAEPNHIRALGARIAGSIRVEHPQYREQHGSRVIAAPGSDCLVPACDVMCKITQEDWAAANPDIKKYSLSDLRRAYDLGHAQGSLGENGFNNAWRDQALKEI